MAIDKLIRLRGWLTIGEAAREISKTLRRDVSEADMYRLALDGYLALAVYIPVDIEAMCFTDDSEDRPRQQRRISGIWELPMIGVARREAESRFFPDIKMDGTEGVLVQREGQRCQLPALDSSEWPFFPPSALPREASVVVQVAAFDDFAARFTSLDAKPLGARERATLLTIIAALAKELKIDVEKSSAAAAKIEELTQKLDARIPARTISDHLRAIADALERRNSSS